MRTNPLIGLTTLTSRIMLALIFLMSALGNKIPKFNDVAGYMAAEGVPMPQFMLAGAIVFLVAGSVSLVLGFRARWGATLLLIFLVLATYYFHDFWQWPAEALWVLSTNDQVMLPVQQVEMISFMKNVALMGAMLFVIANGAGAWSLDHRKTESTVA